MSWETRARGGRYYTRSRKIAGRVVREYVGTGPIAELVAARDAAERAERAAASSIVRQEQERLAPVEAFLADLDAAIETLARAALLAAGYHQHHRGEWRKKRYGDGEGQDG